MLTGAAGGRVSRTLRLRTLASVCLVQVAMLGAAGCGGGPSAADSPTPVEPGEYVWAVGEGGVILASRDFGAYWIVQRAGGEDAPRGLAAVAFCDDAHGWAVGSGILATSDGGDTWTVQEMPTGVAALTGVACVDARHAWVCGRTGRHSVIIATADAGATWRVQYEGAGASSDLSDVAFADSLHGWAVGDDGIVATSDGGVHWGVQKTVSAVTSLAAVSCTDAQRVWAGGSYGGGADNMILLATRDGGATWRTRTWPRYGAVYDLTTLGPSLVWTATGDRVMQSDDGGLTWRRTPVFEDAEVYALAFATPALGWAVGSELPADGGRRGLVLATTDGGRHWARQTTGSCFHSWT